MGREMIKAAARELLDAGFSVIPIRMDGSKAPACSSWAEFAERPPTPLQFDNLFRFDCGFGVCGNVHGVEILDFETREIYDLWSELAEEEFPGLLASLAKARTPGGGVHVYVRSDCVEGNQKLAVAREKYVDSSGKERRVLIESRGRGGYVIAPPSPGECHPSGVAYKMLTGPSVRDGRWCSGEERNGVFR